MSNYPDWVEERFGDDIPDWAEERWGGGDDGYDDDYYGDEPVKSEKKENVMNMPANMVTFAYANECNKDKFALPGLKLGEIGVIYEERKDHSTKLTPVPSSWVYNVAFNIAIGKNDYIQGGVLIISSDTQENVIYRMQDMMTDFGIDQAMCNLVDSNVRVVSDCKYSDNLKEEIKNMLTADLIPNCRVISENNKTTYIFNKPWNPRLVIIDDVASFYGNTYRMNTNAWIDDWIEIAKDNNVAILCVSAFGKTNQTSYGSQSNQISYQSVLSEYKDSCKPNIKFILRCEKWLGLKPSIHKYSYGTRKMLIDIKE